MNLSLKERLDLMAELKKHMIRFDKIEIAYRICPRKGLGQLRGKKLDNRQAIKHIINYPALTTNPEVLMRLARMEKLTVNSNLQFSNFVLNGDWPLNYFEMNYWYTEQSWQKLAETQKVEMLEVSLSSYCSVADQPKDSFVGLFGMFSDALNQEELLNYLEDNKISEYLELIHFYMTHKYPSLTNPSSYNGTIKPKTQKVIELTAMGFNVSQISSLLHLTERGVSYHLDLAKEALGAKNKMELIYKATNELMI